MTTTVTSGRASSHSERLAIRASYGSLGLACVGFLLEAISFTYFQQNFGLDTPRLAWLAGFLGAVLLTLAVTLHIDHLAYRIGRSAVTLIITGGVLASAVDLPFVVNPLLINEPRWSNWFQAVWATGFVALGVGLASIAIHKEKQIERNLAQVADVGATDPADVTVHASFFSLISAATGAIIYALGTFQQVGDPTGTRQAWVLQVLGMVLIAVGIISHIEHLGRHIGQGAVAFATLGAILFAVANLPYAIDPSTTASVGWGHVCGYSSGAGVLCGAIAVGLVILRKRSVDARSATS